MRLMAKYFKTTPPSKFYHQQCGCPPPQRFALHHLPSNIFTTRPLQTTFCININSALASPLMIYCFPVAPRLVNHHNITPNGTFTQQKSHYILQAWVSVMLTVTEMPQSICSTLGTCRSTEHRTSKMTAEAMNNITMQGCDQKYTKLIFKPERECMILFPVADSQDCFYLLPLFVNMVSTTIKWFKIN